MAPPARWTVRIMFQMAALARWARWPLKPDGPDGMPGPMARWDQHLVVALREAGRPGHYRIPPSQLSPASSTESPDTASWIPGAGARIQDPGFWIQAPG